MFKNVFDSQPTLCQRNITVTTNGWINILNRYRLIVYRVLVGKQEGRRPLVRPRRRWVDNIRMDLQEVGCGYMDWIGLAQDRDGWWRFVNAVMNLGFREMRGIS